MSVHERYKKYISDQRNFFDSLISEEWHTYFSEDWDKVRRYEVARLFDIIQPASILDIGCGCGFHDQVMAGYHFVNDIQAIDYSKKSIEVANFQYPHEKVQRAAADLRDLAPAKYDLVVSWQVIEHLDDPDVYFSSALRILKSDGWLAIFTPNRLRFANVKLILQRRSIQFCDPQHFYEYTPGELKVFGARFRLEFLKWFGYGFSGLSKINRLPIEKRLSFGASFPWIADSFCILFKKP